MKPQSKVKRSFKCDICGKGLTNGYLLKAHKLTHSTRSRHQCDICEKEVYDLKAHRIKHLDNTRYKCDQCPKDYAEKASLKAHKEMFHS